MTEENVVDNSPAPEILDDVGDGPSTPLQHKNPTQEPTPEPVKAPSASDAIKAAMAKVEAEGKAEPDTSEDEDAGEDDKPNDETKADVKEAEGKRQAKEVEAEKPDNAAAKEQDDLSSEGKKSWVSSRLLPKAREVWWNTPGPVRMEFERLEREFTEVSKTHKEASEFRESLREYDEMAKAANTSIKDALDRYVAVDKTLAQDFGRGMAQIAQSHGKNPVEAVAQFMRAAGVLPQQLGAYLQGQPAQQPQQVQQRPQIDPVAQKAMQEVEALKVQLAEQQRLAQIEQAHRDMVEPFRQSHPRFDELEGDIAFFLQSGKIPTSLSPVERLEAAYDMAERINPAPVMPQGNLAEPAENITRLPGKKSISGAPGKSTTSSGKPKIMSIRDSLAHAMRNA